ncbi:MAG TPA: hypothetical protein VFU36_01525 [Jatrophihabitans sp.]|nr:hypothetical protein [Jatrophihabitans sp.]
MRQDPSGPPPYNPAGDDVFTPHTPDFHTAVEKVTSAVHAQKAALEAGNLDEAKGHAAQSQRFTTDMLRHLRQEMAQSLADGEQGKTF